jgi:hypothetical protein
MSTCLLLCLLNHCLAKYAGYVNYIWYDFMCVIFVLNRFENIDSHIFRQKNIDVNVVGRINSCID